jgi:hypothetical protein
LGRRGFLAAGGAVATGSFLHAAAARAASRPISELGVTPDTGDDLSEALQKAIAELSGAGQAVFLPGGTYNLSAVVLPERCAILGVPGHTRLVLQGGESVFTAENVEALHLSGLTVEGGALAGSAREATIENLRVNGAPKAGLALTGAQNINVSRCHFEACGTAAIEIATADGMASTANLTSNLIAGCGTGIALAGSGHVTGNTISGATDFGLRLGGGHEGGTIFANSNIISDCGIGIGVAANEETLLVSLNMINGLQGKTTAAIRAFHGNDLVGPDLAFESAEAYLNLTVVGNVAR